MPFVPESYIEDYTNPDLPEMQDLEDPSCSTYDGAFDGDPFDDPRRPIPGLMSVGAAEQTIQSHGEMLAEAGSGWVSMGGYAHDAMSAAHQALTPDIHDAYAEAKRVLNAASEIHRRDNPYLPGATDVPTLAQHQLAEECPF